MADLHERLASLSPEKRALLEKRLRQAAPAASPDRAAHEPLAIVGVGCRFPGGANSPEAFWDLIINGVDAITETPRDRWDVDEYFDSDPSAPGKVSTRWGGFVDRADEFDASLFGIAPREAIQMDPQQRLLLETTWDALEHAGQAPDRLKGSDTGVFIGVHSHSTDYCMMQFADPSRVDAFSASGSAHNFFSGRLSYLLDLHGPSFVVDTACSSSLVAVHLAVQSLRAGECSMAIAAGVNLMLLPLVTMAASRMHMMSPDGRCKTFDASANGFVRSEGCGVVVIKRLSAAVAAGDRVLAVIRGSAINQDGHTNGITAPNGLSQQAVVRDALRNGQVDPQDISYVEAHGTGTTLGDPIEVEALAAVLGPPRDDGSQVVLGSVKSSIGHLEGAAGIAGLIKAVLCLHHRQLPPMVHFRQVNPHIALAETPFVIPTAAMAWSRPRNRRFAGVSSFGWSGTNSHVVLEEAPDPEPTTGDRRDDRPRLLTFSARTPEALDALGRAWHEWATAGMTAAAADVSHAAAFRRAHHECRAAVVGTGIAEWREGLAALSTRESHPHVITGRKNERHGIVFVFPGQGSQWIGMGRELYATEPAFRESIDRTAKAMAPLVDWSLVEQINGDAGRSRLHEIHVVQPTLFAVEVALAALWQSWGIQPDAVVGHSMGEVAAACVAGALTIEDAARVISLRSQLLRRVSGKGGMAAVELSLEDTARAIAGYETRLSIAVSNSPSSTVISGDVDAIDEVLASLQSRDVFCRPIKVDVASHSPQVDVLRADLLKALDGLKPRVAAVPIYSTVTATVTTGAEFDPEYWTRNLRQPVLLSKAVERLTADGHLTFIEMSPHPILLPSIESSLRALHHEGLVLPSLRREEREREVLLTSVAHLYVAGYDPDWTALNGQGSFVELPRYQYQRERYWLEAATDHTSTGLLPSGTSVHPILSSHVAPADQPGTRVWQLALDSRRLRYLLDHRLEGTAVLPGSVIIEMALAACAEVYGDGPVSIRDVELIRPLALSSEGPAPVVQVTVIPAGDERSELKIFHIEGAAPRLLARASIGGIATVEDRRDHVRHENSASSGDDFYNALEARGVLIGDGLRTVASVAKTANGVTAQLAAPDSLARDVARYRCHPALTDGLLQLIGAALDEDELYLPARIREVRWYGKPHVRAIASVERVVTAAQRQGHREQNFLLTDESSTPVLEISGLELRAFSRTRATRAPERIDDWVYDVEWTPRAVDRSHTVKHPQRQHRWLVFDERSGIGQRVADELRRKGQLVTVVVAGDRCAAEGPDRFMIRQRAAGDYRALLAETCGTERASCRGIVFLWPTATQTPHDGASLLDTFDRSANAALRLLQAVAAHGWAEAPRLWLGTRGAHRVSGSPVSPWQASTWGLGRVIAEEHNELFGGLVDLDACVSAEVAASDLVAAIWEADSEPEVAVRAGQRFVPRLVRRSAVSRTHVRLQRDATYVVTGGFGAVGLAVAHSLVERGARRLVMIGRTTLPPRSRWASTDPTSEQGRRIAAIRALEADGASVHIASMRLDDETQVASYFDAFEAEGWPAVRGVVHCAAHIEPGLLARTTEAAFVEAFAAKAVGAFVLQRRLAAAPLDFFVNFSSIAALLPQPGQGSYAAANAYLDALGAEGDERVPTFSVNWGVWRRETGAADGVQQGVELYERSGILPFDARDGLELLGRLLTQRSGNAVAMPVDWSTYLRARGESHPPLVSELIAETSRGSESDAGTVSFRQTLEAAAPADRSVLLEDHLQQHLARVLRLPVSRLDPVTPLGSLGLESLMTLELRNRLETSLGIKLSATLVWNHPTVRALASYLAGRLGISLEQESEATADTPALSGTTLVGNIAELSEDDALRALIGDQ